MTDSVTAATLICSNLTSTDADNATARHCQEAMMATSSGDAGGHGLLLLVTVTLYGIVCGTGTFGNTAVVAVIAYSCAMRSTVTNIYIVNLAVSDFCFLAGLPLLIVTALRQVRQ